MNEITYNDTDRLREIMVGRHIVETRKKFDTRNELETVEFELDNGVILVASSAYGCGGCENGYWPVDTPNNAPTQVITNVEVVDEMDADDYGAHLRMFIYAEGIKTEIIHSEGTDNGYYGWGYEVFVTEKKD